MKVSIKQYAQTLFELTDGKSEQEVSDVVKRFAQQLKADGQLKNAGKITEKFSELYNATHGIVEAEVITRSEIGDGELGKIEKFILKKYSGNKVEIRNIVDEKIKGGIVIKVGDEVIDGSIAIQLKRLRKHLEK